MARITIDGDIATFSAKLFVTPSLWNTEAGKVNGKSAEAVEINPQLEETDRGYLTEEELQTIANTVFVDKQTNLVRDMFLFGCLTNQKQ